jgi:hypothetical protein
VLPEDRDKHEYRCDEYDGERDLRDRSRWEWFDFSFTTGSIFLLVPSWESCEEQEADECEYDRDDAESN